MKNREKRFKQIVHYVEDKIRAGGYRIGDKIPSVNAWVIRFGISRSSVFLAMNELKSRGLIEAEPSVGYYVASSEVKIQEKVLLLFNEFTAFKEDIYNSFITALGGDVSVDVMFHNYKRFVLDSILRNNNGNYTTIVVMPGKFEGLKDTLQGLSAQVILLAHCLPELKGHFSFLGQDYTSDYNALCSGLDSLRKYSAITMVQKDDKEPDERYYGVSRFCEEFGFAHDLVETMEGRSIEKGMLYITVTDRELVTILKKAAEQGLTAGKDFGIISYNDTPTKEILCGGISTLTNDFRQMGRTLAQMVREKKIRTISNPSNLIIRSST